MKEGYISIIDLGTSSIRNSIYDLDGRLVKYNRYGNPVFYPKPGWVEQDPKLWWDLLKKSYLDLPKPVRLNIKAISVTSQREGIVPVNQRFEPLDNIIIWLDGRTEKEAVDIKNALGRDCIYDICGLVPHPVWSLSKILWLKRNKPRIFKGTSKFLQAEDYFVSRLSKQAVTEFSIASRTCLLDVKNKKWSEKILDKFEIEISRLPELMEPGTQVGNIDPHIATEFDLNPETKIFTGAGDQQAAAVGSGAVFAGSVSIGIGTSSALSVTIEKPIPDHSKRIILNCAALPGMWEYEPPIWNTGGLIKWYFDQFKTSPDKYAETLKLSTEIPAGSEGLIALPYFSGSGSPRWNPAQKGVFSGLTLAHTKIHLLKALMESVAFEIKLNLDSVRKSGIEIKSIILSGGASQNIPLCQIIADVIQMEIEISSETEASSKGCFILIKAALENNTDYKGIFQSVSSKNKTILPHNTHARIYKQIYKNYIQLGNLFDHNQQI
ncbi:MAG: FGGY-family carbohydrate kinase [Bacteroidota bacterium]